MPASNSGAARQAVTWVRRQLLELLFPTRCAGCGQVGSVWCSACQARLIRAKGEVCLSCGGSATRRGHDCPPQAPRARAAARYRFPLDRALTRLKYRPDERLVEAMSDLLVRACRGFPVAAQRVVPVPLSARRQRQRGYNQVERLSGALARRLQVPMEAHALTRIRDTVSQVGLTPEARRANVEGAFRADPAAVAGLTVLLVDDVHTTGATLSAGAAALLQAGATAVMAVTVGRT